MEDDLEKFYIEEEKHLKHSIFPAIASKMEAALVNTSHINHLIQIDDSVCLIA